MWIKKIPSEYHEFLNMFNEKLGRELPPQRFCDDTIPLLKWKETPFGPLYGISRDEMVAVKEYIEENHSNGFIRASSSKAGAPILCIEMGDGSLPLCMDYRIINEITVNNRYALP